MGGVMTVMRVVPEAKKKNQKIKRWVDYFSPSFWNSTNHFWVICDVFRSNVIPTSFVQEEIVLKKSF